MMMDNPEAGHERGVRTFVATQNIWRFGSAGVFAMLSPVRQKRSMYNVDLALRLDVLAICAVFAFVGAILLGAF
jgi:uncharacterized membrane protein